MLEKIIGLLFATIGVGAMSFMLWVSQTSTNEKSAGGARPYIGVFVYIIGAIFGPKYIKERVNANTDKLIERIPFISIKKSKNDSE